MCWIEHNNSMDQSPFCKPVRKFSAINGTPNFISLQTRAYHFYLSWTRPILSNNPDHTILWRIILMYSSIFAWIFQVVFYSNVSRPKSCTHLSALRATCPVHLIFLDLIIRKNIWWWIQIIKAIVHFSAVPCYLLLLRPRYSPQQTISEHPKPIFNRLLKIPT